jgi:serine/threonine-protein kinase
VTLAVSAGQQIVDVPSVVGLSQADAQTALEAAGFELGQSREGEHHAARAVVESRPAAGTKTTIPVPWHRDQRRTELRANEEP